VFERVEYGNPDGHRGIRGGTALLRGDSQSVQQRAGLPVILKPDEDDEDEDTAELAFAAFPEKTAELSRRPPAVEEVPAPLLCFRVPNTNSREEAPVLLHASRRDFLLPAFGRLE
jgi:hypothetical protein